MASSIRGVKAAHFTMNKLKIGSFKVESKCALNLVAKCYYARRKLVWEILQNDGFLDKIEVEWQNISAIRAVINQNSPGILEIEVDKVPSFYHEIEAKSGRRTSWEVSEDFTHGQASKYRRHYLEFPPGVLDQHYLKLLQCDNRLLDLSQKLFPSSHSAYFDHVHGAKITLPSQKHDNLFAPQRMQSLEESLPLIANKCPTFPTWGICPPTHQPINHQMLQDDAKRTSWSQFFNDEYDSLPPMEYVPYTSGIEAEESVSNNELPSHSNYMLQEGFHVPEIELSNNMLQESCYIPEIRLSRRHEEEGVDSAATTTHQSMRGAHIVDDGLTSSCLGTFPPTDNAINHQMLQDDAMRTFWNQCFDDEHENFSPMENVPYASGTKGEEHVSNILEIQFSRRHSEGVNSATTTIDQSMKGAGIVPDGLTTSSCLGIFPPTDNGINHQMLQDDAMRTFWNQCFDDEHENFSPMENVPYASGTKGEEHVSNIPEIQFSRRHSEGVNSATTTIDQSMEGAGIVPDGLTTSSCLGICHTMDPEVNNHMLQPEEPRMNYDMPNHFNYMLQEGSRNPETEFNGRRHMEVNIQSHSPNVDQSMEISVVHSANTSTQIDWPLDDNSWKPPNGLEQQFCASDPSSLNPMDEDEHCMFYLDELI